MREMRKCVDEMKMWECGNVGNVKSDSYRDQTPNIFGI
jgi:hypothetical protein